MARTVIDIDDEALAQAMKELGTTTKVDTVNAALRLAAGISERVASAKRLMQTLREGDLDNPEVMRGAWTRHTS